MFIGFFMVFLSYALCGVLGAFGFNSVLLFADKLPTQQNCLNMYDQNSIIAIIIRICCFCQLLACCSLIFACQRSQILLLVTGSSKAKSDKVNIILNLLILIIPAILGVVYPQVGKLAGILGALAGFLVIYFLPTLTYLS